MAVSNPLKLALVVLGFFLALTFVRAVTVDTDVNHVVFVGEKPFAFDFSVTNTRSQTVKPNLVVDGPFTLVLSEEDAAAVIPGNETYVYHATLLPVKSLEVGDVYQSQIRVLFPDEEKVLPLTVTKKNPDWIPPALGTGFVTWGSVPFVDAILIVIVLILAIALVARVHHRITGGSS